MASEAFKKPVPTLTDAQLETARLQTARGARVSGARQEASGWQDRLREKNTPLRERSSNMANTQYQYKVVPWHGERESLWYLVQWPVADPEDWEVVASYRTRDEAGTACSQQIAAHPKITPAYHGKD